MKILLLLPLLLGLMSPAIAGIELPEGRPPVSPGGDSCLPDGHPPVDGSEFCNPVEDEEEEE